MSVFTEIYSGTNCTVYVASEKDITSSALYWTFISTNICFKWLTEVFYFSQVEHLGNKRGGTHKNLNILIPRICSIIRDKNGHLATLIELFRHAAWTVSCFIKLSFSVTTLINHNLVLKLCHSWDELPTGHPSFLVCKGNCHRKWSVYMIFIVFYIKSFKF